MWGTCRLEIVFSGGCWFTQYPGRHAAAVLDDGGFDWIDQLGTALASVGEQHWFVYEEPMGVAYTVPAVGKNFEVHTDARGETTEEQAAGFEDAPKFIEHGEVVFARAGEVQDCAADHHIGNGIGKWHLFDRADAEIFWRGWIAERGSEPPYLFNSLRICVDREYVAALAQQVDEIPPGTAAGVEHGHGGGYVSAKELIE